MSVITVVATLFLVRVVDANSGSNYERSQGWCRGGDSPADSAGQKIQGEYRDSCDTICDVDMLCTGYDIPVDSGKNWCNTYTSRNVVGNGESDWYCYTKIDGVWGEWGDWSDCTVTCGGGTSDRIRECTGPEHGGKECEGEPSEQRTCNNEEPCPVHGVWGEWGDWSDCTVTCGEGTSKRIRECTGPEHGGKECEGEPSEQRICNKEVPCPVDGVWGEWVDWSDCTVTCGEGTSKRLRECTGLEHGGKECEGDPSEQRICNKEVPCPVIKSETTLECLKDKMRVTLDSAKDVDVYSLKGSGVSCSPAVSATTIDISLNDCGTTSNHNTSHIIYENTLTGESAVNSVIGRGALLVLDLKCSYERNGTTTVLSWMTGQAVIEIEAEGIFTFNLDVYDTFTSDEFGTKLVSPFNIDLRDTLYFAITLDAADALTLTIEIVHIIAMDSSDIESSTTNKYYIVQDGCAEDSTYNVITPTGDNTKRKSFSIEAFNFVTDGTADVYIHGVVKICDSAKSYYTTCSKAPVCSKRRRRSTELAAKDHERTFQVYGGPFLFNDDTDNKGYNSHVSAVIMLLWQTFLLLLNF